MKASSALFAAPCRETTEIITTLPSANRVRVQTTVVGLMIAFSVMSYFDRTIMSIAGPGMMKEFSLSASQMGAVYTAFLISYAAMNLPGGYLADRFGPRVVLTIVGSGAGLFTALTALGGKPGLGVYLGVIPSFFLFRFALGICTGPLYPTCARTMASWIPRAQHARIWGFIAAGAGLGGATSPLLFSWMISRYGWRMSFCMAGIATAILALIWCWYVRDHPSQHPSMIDGKTISPEQGQSGERPESTESIPWAPLLTNSNLILLSLGYFAVSYFEYIYFFWIYYYLGEIRHLESNHSAVATTIILLTWMVMSPLGGWVSDLLVKRHGPRAGRRIVPVVGLTLGALLLCFAINLTDVVGSVALLSLSFGFASCSDGPYWAAAISVGGRHAGAVCGILNTSGNLGGVAPYIAPVIATYAGWSWGLYSASMVLLVAVITWFFIDPTKTALSESVLTLQES